jgi:hypothetical protein
MDFRPLSVEEQKRLGGALRANSRRDKAIIYDRKDTSFVGTEDHVSDDEVISAIRSVPTHY